MERPFWLCDNIKEKLPATVRIKDFCKHSERAIVQLLTEENDNRVKIYRQMQNVCEPDCLFRSSAFRSLRNLLHFSGSRRSLVNSFPFPTARRAQFAYFKVFIEFCSSNTEFKATI